MNTIFHNKRITSIFGILPETIGYFDDELDNYDFPAKQTLRLKKVMGFNQHRLAKESSTVSDFAVYGLDYMIQNEWIRKEEIGAVIVVTLCPDYFVPHISTLIQAKCDLNTDTLCMDVSQGCCGYLLGLMQSFMILDHLEDKKVVLINGDVLSHKVSKRDRNDFPLIGDATTITVLENGGDNQIYYEMHNDGKRGNALMIPAGGFRMPSTADTAEMINQGDGNYRALDHMHMDGGEVFNFVQVEIPTMLEKAFVKAGKNKEEIDWYLFHQPNKFMLQKLAQKIGIPEVKMPMNLVENVGNPSGASIPLTAILNISEELKNKMLNCCLSAFGSGLSWGVVFMKIGLLQHCDLIEAPL